MNPPVIHCGSTVERHYCHAPVVESRAKKCPGAGLRARGVRARPTREACPVSDSTSRVAGIETMYHGTLFRSRLEAKWASFMRQIGWDAVYEPFDANGYIPDFAVTGPMPLLIEVKPAVSVEEMKSHVARLEPALRGHWAHDVLILGVSPITPSLYDGCFPTAGVLGEWTGPYDNNPGEWVWGEANWIGCAKCGLTVVCHSEMSYAGRPCGHHDGDHYMASPNRELIEEAWAIATNLTRWTKRR